MLLDIRCQVFPVRYSLSDIKRQDNGYRKSKSSDTAQRSTPYSPVRFANSTACVRLLTLRVRKIAVT